MEEFSSLTTFTQTLSELARTGYDRDLVARVRRGVGEATVRLPSEVGVRVEAQGGLDQINAEASRRRVKPTSMTPTATLGSPSMSRVKAGWGKIT
jgi:hypothetical protein